MLLKLSLVEFIVKCTHNHAIASTYFYQEKDICSNMSCKYHKYRLVCFHSEVLLLYMTAKALEPRRTYFVNEHLTSLVKWLSQGRYRVGRKVIPLHVNSCFYN